DEADGPRLRRELKVGQRLVSARGALWRWDGLTASADAPTAAALRLQQKNRLAELETEATEATRRVRAAEETLVASEDRVRRAVDAEKAARDGWREAQRLLGEARETLARAEKAVGEIASRRAALDESRGRLVETLE